MEGFFIILFERSKECIPPSGFREVRGAIFTSKETPTLLVVQRRSSGPRVDENSSKKNFFMVSKFAGLKSVAENNGEKKKTKKVCVSEDLQLSPVACPYGSYPSDHF